VRPKSREVHPVDGDEDDQLRQLKVEEGHCNAPDEGVLQGPLSPPSLSLEARRQEALATGNDTSGMKRDSIDTYFLETEEERVSVSEGNTDEEATEAALPPISCVSHSQVIKDPAL
jgi:hypothetical protein